jgi:transcription-repair coupling factor (superfamily II helicase)
MWEELTDRIESLPPFRDLRAKLGARGVDVSVCGLYGSSRSLVLSRLAAAGEEPVLVLAADPVKARDIAEDLKLFGLDGVVSYPEDEILPYDYHDPDRTLTGLQMKALESLIHRRCRALVCTYRSVLKKVFSPALFESLVLALECGGEYDTEELASRLIHLGYERQGIVEAKGQFALRGGIVDIYEVGEEMPVRMEFDGDEIASMRDFDIESQRSTNERTGLVIRPLHHLAPEPDGLVRLKNRLEQETEGMEEEERSRMMLPVERLEKGISFFGMEHYAAAVHDVVPLFEYFASDPLVVLFDAEELEAVSTQFREEIADRFERSREEGNLYPEPDEVYITEAAFDEKLEGLTKLRFRNLAQRGSVKFSSRAPGDFRRNLGRLQKAIASDLQKEIRVFFFCSSTVQRDRAEELLPDVALDIDFPIGELSSGFRWEETGHLFLSEEEVFGRYHRPYHTPRTQRRSLNYDPSHFKPGDFLVHVNHGIGRYMGLRVLEIDGGKTECIALRYEGADHLFIPVSQLRFVEKYIAAEGTDPQLGRLGSGAWARARERARKSAGKIAKDLLEIYAARQLARGHAFEADKPWQKEMEASFPYEETPHQIQATSEVKRDMELERPMDRLLCGDVGFGKTEVALRAAFKTVLSGKQCAILVPTTVLALQHYGTVSDRLQGFPIDVKMLSRFVTSAKQKKVISEISDGTADIVIGTHRLLSKDVAFKDLGLVIVDEEHRFGVRHKETFKKLKKSIDVLSMTATPIPRTLSMAISGIRDLSVIDTPPRNRLPIHTEILAFDDDRIREAVLREVDRGGQVFFVHNRVQSISVMEGYLNRLLPERVRVAHAHGQMKERELENIMIDFLEGKFDVLVCTMIIEAGLDFPNVNTIIINRADKFGLAQLYQLRGRVGRSDRKAYAYMLVPGKGALTPTAVKRLQAISEFDYLGAGYRIAMRDLEIRGAGNLLGPQQSGHISAVGLDLYSRMLREEVSSLKGEPPEEEVETVMSIPIPAYFPDSYILDSEERMDIYRRLMKVESGEQAGDIRDELIDRFGPMPEQAENIIRLVDMKARARIVGVASVEADGSGRLMVGFDGGRLPGKKVLAAIADTFRGRLEFRTEEALGLVIEPPAVFEDPGAGRGGALSPAAYSAIQDFESLLNLLEFSAK